MESAQKASRLDIGLFVLRCGVGIAFIIHGWPKLTAGPAMWNGIGMSMGNLGITFAPVLWGFLASVAEFVGGILLIVGLGTRTASAFMAFTMLVAAIFHISKGDGFSGASHAIELLVVFISLMLTGPGSLHIGKLLRTKGTT